MRPPDISLARKLLGWEPHVPLEERLQRTISYFQRIAEAKGAVANVLQCDRILIKIHPI